MKLPLTGGCQCGAVRYEIDAEPLTVIACHCTQCQQSASAFGMTVPVPRAALTITDCGVRLYHEPANKAFLNLKAGTFDDTSWDQPRRHIWTERAPKPG